MLPDLHSIACEVYFAFRQILAEVGHRAAEISRQQDELYNAIEDAFEDYRLWAGNLGAFHDSADPRSLDHRFRKAPHVRKRTAEHLNKLLELLERGEFCACRTRP